ncbi:hypothetical protein L3X38_031242 [Prunus dulcis]|uniref:Transmembrane protein n=1 Tax=Prunus dulcis TaxID=3755 RepID=A0AAD4VBU6_PRUDU|nr:hypothetical protein L3X38_031242 [Prunus dulcis]
MQQRLWSYSSRVPDQEYTVVAIGSAAPQQPQLKHHHHHTPRTNPDGLPHYDPRSGFGKKEGSWRSVSAEKWIHVIPVIVLFCLFVLWWFSVSVKVVSIDRRITAIRETEIPLPLNESRIDIAILAAAAMSPIALVPQNLTVNKATEVPSAEKK